ncbi:hypothetical protein Tco_0498080, partial [Tanacetum coccineum]
CSRLGKGQGRKELNGGKGCFMKGAEVKGLGFGQVKPLNVITEFAMNVLGGDKVLWGWQN